MKNSKKIFYIITAGFILITTTGCGIITGTTTKITFDSEPRGAEVLLNNEMVGKTPTTVELKNNIKYDLRIRHPEFQDYRYHFGNKISVGTIVADYYLLGCGGFGTGYIVSREIMSKDGLESIAYGSLCAFGSLFVGYMVEASAGGLHKRKIFSHGGFNRQLHNNIFFYDFNTNEVTIINK